MMTVVRLKRAVRFVEQQLLAHADSYSRDPGLGRRRRTDDLPIEARDTISLAFGHVEGDVRHAELYRTESVAVRAVAADAIAPGAGHFDVIGPLVESEARLRETL